ncbi:hypothetical protein [Spirosoma pomorum]
MIKLSFITLLVAICLGHLGAQAQSNTLLLYGNVGFNSQKVGTTSSSDYTFAPGVGYQWNDRWTGGFNLALKGSNQTDRMSSVGAGPFIRYTRSLSDIFVVYGQFNADYLSGNTGTTSYRGFQGTLFPAIGVNLKNSFALNFNFGSISFSSQKFDGNADPATNVGFAFGSGIGFGMSKNFGLGK